VAEDACAVLQPISSWFNPIAPWDGYSIYGGRADLRFEEYDPINPLKTARSTPRRSRAAQMEIRRDMNANRDQLFGAAVPAKRSS